MFLTQKDSNKRDEDLIDDYRKTHDRGVLGTIFSRYSALVYGVCLKYLKDPDEAKDAVMQLFEKLATSLLEHNIQSFKSWLYVSSRNHCLMKLRAQKSIHKKEISGDLMESELILHPEEEDTREYELQRLEKCIEELKDEQKDCVKLFYLKELCYKDIVKHTGIELNKVKSYIQNGKRNLKICMDQSG